VNSTGICSLVDSLNRPSGNITGVTLMAEEMGPKRLEFAHLLVPNGNALAAESFIGRLRDELLNETLFRSLAHTRVTLEAWRADYNQTRPPSRLGWMSPAGYAAARRSAALRSTDGSAPRTATITAQQGNTDCQTPIVAG
jgi:hypothetical protein